MTIEVNDRGDMEDMFTGGDMEQQVKSIRSYLKNRYCNHFKNYDNSCAGKSYSDPRVKNLQGVKQGGKWYSLMTQDRKISVFIEVKEKMINKRQ